VPRGINIGFNVGPLTLAAFTGLVQLQAPGAALASTVPRAVSLATSPGLFTLSGIPAALSAAGGAFVTASAPAQVLLSLQGQTSANSTTSAPAPSSPNFQQVTWTAAVAGTYPIASYNVYRSVNGAAFVLYASGITGLSYSDSAATLCVNGTAGSTPPYYKANNYYYEITAVDTHGNEGPRSGTQQYYIFKNGYNWGGNYDNGATSTFNDTSGAPVGGGTDIKVVTSNNYGETLYYSGDLVTQWNQWAGVYTYLYIDIKPTISGMDWQLYAIRCGDVPIYNSSGVAYNVRLSSYGTFTANTWTTLKIPLADFLTDCGTTGSGPAYAAVVQNAFYKFAIQDVGHTAPNTWYYNNIRLSNV
jgi:hypothetical protein